MINGAHIATVLLMLASCEDSEKMPPEFNRPIAQSEVQSQTDFDRVRQIVSTFSHSNNFAIQETVSVPQGRLDFSIRLFRDDITVTVSRLHGEPIKLAAFPLCVCELGKRKGLQASADAAVNGLAEELSKLK
jgi:hypothetical protein